MTDDGPDWIQERDGDLYCREGDDWTLVAEDATLDDVLPSFDVAELADVPTHEAIQTYWERATDLDPTDPDDRDFARFLSRLFSAE